MPEQADRIRSRTRVRWWPNTATLNQSLGSRITPCEPASAFSGGRCVLLGKPLIEVLSL